MKKGSNKHVIAASSANFKKVVAKKANQEKLREAIEEAKAETRQLDQRRSIDPKSITEPMTI
jgi:hypothetical protein